MTNLIHPDRDAPVENMDIHKDIVWVIRTLWGGAVFLVLAAMWVAALASDVEQNKEKLDSAATQDQLSTTVEILRRLEDKIDKQDERQRDIQQDLSSLKTEVQNLKEKTDGS